LKTALNAKNLRILRFAGLPIFYGFLKRLKKLPFYFFILLVGYKNKKPANPWICRFFVFWWGEQDSNFKPGTRI
jgi:hypothetical protein